METWRVALAASPGFHVAVERGRDASLNGCPVAVVRGGKVLEVSTELGNMGLAPGVRRANLLEICPEARVIAYEPERYEEAQCQLLDLYARHVPAVEPLDAAHAFLDVAGLGVGSGVGSLPALGQAIAREARAAFGMTVVFGLGQNKLAARAAGFELVRRGSCRPGEVFSFPGGIDALSVRYLYPFPPEVAERLERLGFERIGEVRALPFGELVRQFGRPLASRLAAAMAGGEIDPVRPAWPPLSLRSVRRFEGGLGDRGTLRQTLEEAAGRFAREMTNRGLAASEVALVFRAETGAVREASRRLQRPARSRTALVLSFMGLAERLLAAWEPGAPPVEMEARAARVGPLPAEQLDFEYVFGHFPAVIPAPEPGLGRAPSRVARSGPPGDEVREVARQLAWRFGDRVIRGLDAADDEDQPDAAAYRRARRENLLVFYDPLRSHG